MGNKRIALNTVFTVAQSLIATVCGLFTGRWILNALGHEGYGVLAVVGGVMVFVLFFNKVLTNSASRHFAYAIGKSTHMQEEDRIGYMGEWFVASFYVHLFLPIVLCGVGYFVGEWYITQKLVVAESMRGECLWAFRFSLLAAFFAILSAPYFAIYTAKQLIFVRTIFGFGMTVLNTVGAYALFFFDSNRIFYHAAILMGVQVFTTILIVIFAMIKFPEVRRFSSKLRWNYVRELFAFGGAQMLGMFGNMLRAQGMAIVVNHFSGLKVNAGQGIGNHITSKASIFSTAIMGAILPEVTTCLSSGRRSRAFSIAEKINLFIPISYVLVISPVVVCIHPLLVLWLKVPPDYAVAFCGISLFTMYFDALTGGYQQLINANGKILSYQICMGLLLVSSVFVATMCYICGFSTVVSVGAGVLLPTVCSAVIRLVFMKGLFGVSCFTWLRRTLLPNVIILCVSYITSAMCVWAIGEGVFQFFIIGAVNFLIVVGVALVLISKEDKVFVMQQIQALSAMLQRKTK